MNSVSDRVEALDINVNVSIYIRTVDYMRAPVVRWYGNNYGQTPQHAADHIPSFHLRIYYIVIFYLLLVWIAVQQQQRAYMEMVTR